MKAQQQSSNLRKTQAEERRLQILDVALAEFASRGFKGTSIKDISQTAGISAGLMYHYFKSKQDLLEATVKYHSFLPQMRQILMEGRGRASSEVFNDLATEFLKLLDTKAGLVRVFLRELDSNPVVKKTWSNLVHEGVAILKEYIDTQVAEGELRPHNTEVSARSMLGIMIMNHLTQDIFHSYPVKREEFVREVISFMMEGMRAK
jgi:AcrR family transcriptional regulator